MISVAHVIGPSPRLWCPLVKRPAHHFGQVHVLGVDAQSAALPAGQLEQVIRQSNQPPRVANQTQNQALAQCRAFIALFFHL